MNTKSRHGSDWFEQSREKLVAAGIQLEEARPVKHPRDVSAWVEKQIRNGVPLVIVGGGDGTFSAVAHLFARKETILGVLPLGTGNAFARDLGIPAQVNAACNTILNGKVAKIDMGIIGNRDFVNVATVGLSTKIALGLQDTQKKKFGRAVYIVSVIRALASIQPFHVKLELPSGTHEFESLQVVIGNGRFHAGPFQVAPDAAIDGGWLSIYALASTRKMDFFKMVLHMRGGRHVDLPEVQAFRAKQGELTTSPIHQITIDGETGMKTPAKFGIIPGGLRVMVPQEFDESRLPR